MVEQQTIKGREVWIKVDPYHVHRENHNIIPTEYFTASYFLNEPIEEIVGHSCCKMSIEKIIPTNLKLECND